MDGVLCHTGTGVSQPLSPGRSGILSPARLTSQLGEFGGVSNPNRTGRYPNIRRDDPTAILPASFSANVLSAIRNASIKY